ncbi:class I SAM-dependent methyltransferase [Streptomyces sp. NPDC057623]|uniref:class I SAM-dependent methyltransferase n=1 Tax=Streptomyces sp. NPDC057623 TaxID=3346187 RepID=UPI0036A39815
MSTHSETARGERISDVYDELYGDFTPSPAQLDVLSEYASSGVAVEIGSGTGRVAIPLARRGVRIIGVDASPSMTDELFEKARGLEVEAVCADAAEYRPPESAALVFAVFNTFFLLATKPIQEGFVARAADMLAPGGRLVLETFVPHLGRLPDGPTPGTLPEESDVVVKRWVPDGVVLFAASNTPQDKRFDYQEIILRHGEPVRIHPGRMRYMWPSEIDDLMAEHGLRLEDRWADWERSPYEPDSRKHVSVYTR